MTTYPSTVRATKSRCCDLNARPSRSFAEAESVAVDFAVLAHPVRLQLLDVLARNGGRVCVCDLEAAVPVKQPTVSHHLSLLRRAGLVEAEKAGIWVYYHVKAEAFEGLRARLGERPRGRRRLPVQHARVLSSAIRARNDQGAPTMTDERCCCGPTCCAPQAADTAPTPAAADEPAPSDGEAVRATVRERYGEAARQAAAGAAASCGCGPSCCGGDEVWDPITADLYEQGETAGMPAAALLASLGCGNPTALAALERRRDACSTSVPAAASTSCSRRAASDPPAWPTAST